MHGDITAKGGQVHCLEIDCEFTTTHTDKLRKNLQSTHNLCHNTLTLSFKDKQSKLTKQLPYVLYCLY